MAGAATLVASAAGLAVVTLAVGALTVVVGERSAAAGAGRAESPDRCGAAWTAAWRTSPQPLRPDRPLAGRTLRMVLRPQVTGSAVRLRLSNRFDTAPLALGPVSVARAATGADLVPATARPVTFGGGPAGAVVPPGAELVSDPVAVEAEAGHPLAVSLVLLHTPQVVAEHPVALRTSYLSGPGDASLDGGAPSPRRWARGWC